MTSLEKNSLTFVRKPEVLKRFKISNSQLYKLIQEGTFPPPIKINTISVWIQSELDDYAEKIIRISRGVVSYGGRKS